MVIMLFGGFARIGLTEWFWFGKALGLIAEGKAIRYVGVIGPVQFDENGDITGPFRLWRIQDGEVTTTGEMSPEDVAAIMAGIE